MPTINRNAEKSGSQLETAQRGWIHGLTAAFASLIFFVYPHRAYPIEGLIFLLLFIAMALLYLFGAWKANRISLLKSLAHPATVCFALFAAYTFLRWELISLPTPLQSGLFYRILAPGRDAVVTAQFALLSLIFGISLGVQSSPSATVWTSFRRLLVIAGLGLALHGFYQYFIGYEQDRRELESALDPSKSLSPLMAQSLRHALIEKRVGGRLGNGNVFAALLVTLTALGLGEMFQPRRTQSEKNMRIVAAVSLAASFIAILLTQSRGGLLTLGFAIFLAIAMRITNSNWPRRPPLNPAMLFLIAALAFSILAKPAPADTQSIFTRIGNVSTIQERLNYWHVAIGAWKTNWIFGVGPGGFELLYPALKPPTARESRFAHSWFFQNGAETGFLGLALLTSAFGMILWIATRHSRKAEAERKTTDCSREILWLGGACATLIFNGLFEYSLQCREFWILLMMMSGGIIGMYRTGSEGAASPSTSRLSGVVLGCAALSIGIAISMTPRDQIANFWKWEAKLASQDGDHPLAAKYFESAARWRPDECSFYADRAMELISIPVSAPKESERNLEEATALAKRAQELNPLSPGMRRARALLAQRAGKLKDAGMLLNEAVGLYPCDAGYRLDRAENLLRLNLTELAVKDLKFIEENKLPIWEFQRDKYEDLKKRAGLSP
ncbi:O-antigen ligase family protein [Candidatus Sumerlaeota bacterium]|nr:O-antigen ligase family protein [Candidatus Sumerlaeota bacterium]